MGSQTVRHNWVTFTHFTLEVSPHMNLRQGVTMELQTPLFSLSLELLAWACVLALACASGWPNKWKSLLLLHGRQESLSLLFILLLLFLSWRTAFLYLCSQYYNSMSSVNRRIFRWSILPYSAVATGVEKVSFHSNPEERQYQRMFKLLHNCIHLTH